MKKILACLFFICTVCTLLSCDPLTSEENTKTNEDTSFINTSHLDYLTVPVTFANGTKAAGIYIYAEAPGYHFVKDTDEGFTCVDDVARAAQVYLRSKNFSSDTATQAKAKNLIRFILEMQSDNGYFYNFLFPPDRINRAGATSINNANWWSWRALYTLAEAAPLMKNIDASLATKINAATNKLVTKIKTDLVNIPATTKVVSGITVPQWLPAGSATDQAAIIILGLIPYCEANPDTVLSAYLKKLADGIVMMQQGNATHFPYACFLSWENVWHAYGNDQAYALLKAATFLNDTIYSQKALFEVNNFYPWLLQNGFKSSFSVIKNGDQFTMMNEKKYEQIAYGIRPMVFAAAEAFHITGEEKYADIAGKLAAWLLGANEAGINMYDKTTGRGYDGIIGKDSINYNSGAESTIEALLTLQKAESHPAILNALQKYKKQ